MDDQKTVPQRAAKKPARETLEDKLAARAANGLAMQAGLSFAGDEVRIVFAAVGPHERLSLKVDAHLVTVEGD